MNTLSFNTGFTKKKSTDIEDVLSKFKQNKEKKLTIKEGMSAEEISEIVSKRVIKIIEEQFKLTKEQFEEE